MTQLQFTTKAIALLCTVGCLRGMAQDAASIPKEIYNSEQQAGEPVDASEAVEMLQLPDGFKATVFASEPQVMNPIAATTDAQGRVWVAENFTYAERTQRFDLDLNDRVIVLEDINQDGMADKRTVFMDGLKVLTGITVGRGGVWLMAPPQLLFVPDADGDLIPDGPAQVMLDGFHRPRENYHNFANGLSWGPDHWLYGRSGASAPGDMGLPGSTDEERVPVRGGMWRYHPERKVVEALAQGTTNPWGHDWNENGDLFYINTVNGHFWHCIPGAHYVRPHTLDMNVHSYELIDMHADHWHFDTGKSWTASRDGAANDYGGGHAHIGMLLYQEPFWPQRYQGRVMTVNMHGRRVNMERLERRGSGYVAKHDDDFLISDDSWFRGMELLQLPDGNVLLVDWSDTGECHEHTGVHRTSGRIYQISYEPPNRSGSGLSNPLADEKVRSDPEQLVQLQKEPSEWVARRSRELLAQMGLTGVSVASKLANDMLVDERLATKYRLRGLWCLMALKEVNEVTIDYLLSRGDENLRCWGIRLLTDGLYLDTAYGNRPPQLVRSLKPGELERLTSMANSDPSSKVRLELASAIQRLPLDMRSSIAKGLVTHVEDVDDHNLPLMVWYGLIPLGEKHLTDLIEVLEASQWPKTRQLIARRIADRSKVSPDAFDSMYRTSMGKSPSYQRDVLLGTSVALAGWSKAKQPAAWNTVSEQCTAKLPNDQALRSAVQSLNLLFGDGRTFDELMRVAKDESAALELRKSALQSLVEAGGDGTKELCLNLLNKRFLNAAAAAGLAKEQDPSIGPELVKAYRRFHPSERGQLISILASRASWSKDLLLAIGAGQIDRSELSAFQARQIASHGEDVSQLLAEHWGQVRGSPREKRELIDKLKLQLSEASLSNADKSAGRKLFQKSCANCHRLFGTGGVIGPDLTGAQRSNLDYLLENIVDPSAVVTKEFRATILRTEDDRVLTGLVTEQNDNVVTLATQDETFKIDRDQIAEMKQSSLSTMPDGLLDQLSDEQIRDLFAYLQSTTQVE